MFTGAHPPTPPVNKAGLDTAVMDAAVMREMGRDGECWRRVLRRLLQALHLKVEAILDMPGKYLQRRGFVATFDHIHQRHVIAQ